ncbi:AI-2E family transporter [Pleurocapsa sp. FMAR1]|uniref:AI-2E family transporter n=1 Tax=Pleurocapsa sp. FMAR1 TaxID=3040204 RepID=UPI0029C849E7|nr:AI-2E family transporter [Pleurocapsa sp. FMAR1]
MRLGTLVGFLAILIALYILWRIKQVLLLAFAAVVFATAINQLVKLLQAKFKLNRRIAIAISVGGILIFIVGFIALVIPPFIEQFKELVTLVPDGLEKLNGWNKWLRNFLPNRLIEDFQGIEALTQNLRSWMNGLVSNFFDLFSSTLAVFLNSLLVIVVTIMLLVSPTPYKQVFLLMFPAFYRRRIQSILKKCEKNLGGWSIGILFNMAVIAILSGIGLWALGVRLPLANSLLAGMLTFIPNLGPVLSVVPPTAMALLDAPWKALAVVILYVVIQQVESNILTPIVMKKQVSLLPAITLLSQVAFAVFFGVLGLFLALPITVVAQVWLKEIVVKDILDLWQPKSDKYGFIPHKSKAKNRLSNK